MHDKNWSIAYISALEQFLLHRAVRECRDSILAENPQAEVIYYDAQESTQANLSYALSPSLFATQTICIIENAHKFSSATIVTLSSLLATLPENFWVIISYLGSASSALAQQLSHCAQYRESIPTITKYSDRVTFVKNEFKRYGRSITLEIAQFIVDMVGNDIAYLAAAVSQLSYDCSDRIDIATITRYFHGRPEISGFDVADATISGDRDIAIESLRWALFHGVSHVVIADAIAEAVNTLIRLRSVTGDLAMKAQILSIPVWRVKKMNTIAARKWEDKHLRKAIIVTSQLNAAVKGASAVPEQALERAVYEIAQLAQGIANS